MVAKLSIILSLIIGVIYLPSVSLQFTNWDDDKFVVHNEDIRQLDLPHLKKIFTTFYEGGYTPITQLSFAINYAIGKLNPVGYHATNILLHIANAVLIVWLLRLLKLTPITASVIGLIWAIHPMRVESVTWVSERKDVLFLFFYLIAGVLYLKDCIRSSWVIFVVACLAKHQAALFSLILPIKRWRVNGIFVLTGLCILLINVFNVRGDWTNQSMHTGSDKFFLMNFAAVMYAVKTFFPFQQCVLYPYPDKVNGVFPWFVYGAPFFVLALLGLTWMCRRFNGLIAYGVFFFAINITLPLANIIAGGYLLNDRYIYVAGIGLIVSVALVIEYFYQQQSHVWIKRCIVVGVVMYAIAMGWMTFHRQGVWKDGISLWSDVIRQYPQYARFYDNRGTAYVLAEQYDLALKDFNTAIHRDPNFPGAYNNRAALLLKQSKDENALDDFNKAIELNDKYGMAYYNRAIYLYHHGRMLEALRDLDAAIINGIAVPNDFYGYVHYRVKQLREKDHE